MVTESTEEHGNISNIPISGRTVPIGSLEKITELKIFAGVKSFAKDIELQHPEVVAKSLTIELCANAKSVFFFTFHFSRITFSVFFRGFRGHNNSSLMSPIYKVT